MSDAFPYVLIAGTVAQSIVWLVALLDAVATPRAAWINARRSRSAWLVLIVLLQAVGGLLYWLIARPRLRAAMVPAEADPAEPPS